MKAWLKDFPTQSLVTVTGCLLSVLTALFYFVAELLDHNLDDTTFGVWLAFLASMLGVAYMGFAKKRETWVPTEPDGKDASDVGETPLKGPTREVHDVSKLTIPHLRGTMAGRGVEPAETIVAAESAAEAEERELNAQVR